MNLRQGAPGATDEKETPADGAERIRGGPAAAVRDLQPFEEFCRRHVDAVMRHGVGVRAGHTAGRGPGPTVPGTQGAAGAGGLRGRETNPAAVQASSDGIGDTGRIAAARRKGRSMSPRMTFEDRLRGELKSEIRLREAGA
ncbi:hypothetical protein GCM10011579_033580 [Streptomyces albiflavescens]|uniref:Uncharacterized protein n=1 Tax=Streptomyces albiflavescens TaxID=1623582 RepID=A0A918D4Q3_9ACTN|nr:hypothetical protein GCM10011579_033580 [Streptomyces albiflavescens]